MTTHKEVRTLRVRPLAVLAMLFTVAMLCNALIVGCGGSTQESQTETQTPPATSTTEGTAPAGETPGSAVELGKKIYIERCALCHGPEGKGDGAAAAGLDPKPRNHTDGSYMNAQSNESLIGVIKNGKGAMPAWGTILSDADVNAVLTYVRSLAVPPYQGPMP